MKNLFFAISILFLSFSYPKNDLKYFQIPKEKDSFAYFESLMADSEEISSNLIKKYVKNSFIKNIEIQKFIGREKIYLPKHKVFFIIYGNSDKKMGVLVCYNKKNIQTDSKVYLLSCKKCNIRVSKEIGFLDNKNIEIKHYTTKNKDEMPSEENMNVLKVERYKVNNYGKFVKVPSTQ